LSVVGQDDNLFYTAVAAYNCADPESVHSFEAQYYPAARALKLVVIPTPGSGAGPREGARDGVQRAQRREAHHEQSEQHQDGGHGNEHGGIP
jgi:hypothetical protein